MLCCSWVNLNEEAANAASSLIDGESALDPSVQNNIVSLFHEANTCGFNVIRLFAHGQDVNHQLQLAPGAPLPPSHEHCSAQLSSLLLRCHLEFNIHCRRGNFLACAGRYNESYFRGIDYILAVAGMHNVKVVLLEDLECLQFQVKDQ